MGPAWLRGTPRGDPPPQRPEAIEPGQQQDDSHLDIQAEQLNRFKRSSLHDLLRPFAR
jgi:hypothetical protein